jgi:hypothetical protein
MTLLPPERQAAGSPRHLGEIRALVLRTVGTGGQCRSLSRTQCMSSVHLAKCKGCLMGGDIAITSSVKNFPAHTWPAASTGCTKSLRGAVPRGSRQIRAGSHYGSMHDAAPRRLRRRPDGRRHLHVDPVDALRYRDRRMIAHYLHRSLSALRTPTATPRRSTLQQWSPSPRFTAVGGAAAFTLNCLRPGCAIPIR